MLVLLLFCAHCVICAPICFADGHGTICTNGETITLLHMLKALRINQPQHFIYTTFIDPLVKAIQELNVKVDSMDSRINEMRASAVLALFTVLLMLCAGTCVCII